MITRKQRELLIDTWDTIRYPLNNIDWTPYATRLLDLTLEESKSHDRFRADSISRGIRVTDEAKYFAVKRLYECLEGYQPQLDSYFFTQRSCYAAYCIMTSERFYGARSDFLSKAKESMKEIASWDYCDLIHEEKLSPGYQLDNRRGFKRSPVAAD